MEWSGVLLHGHQCTGMSSQGNLVCRIGSLIVSESYTPVEVSWAQVEVFRALSCVTPLTGEKGETVVLPRVEEGNVMLTGSWPSEVQGRT